MRLLCGAPAKTRQPGAMAADNYLKRSTRADSTHYTLNSRQQQLPSSKAKLVLSFQRNYEIKPHKRLKNIIPYSYSMPAHKCYYPRPVYHPRFPSRQHPNYIRETRRLGAFSIASSSTCSAPSAGWDGGGGGGCSGGEAASLEGVCWASLADIETRTSGLRSLVRRGRGPVSRRERRSSALWWRAAAPSVGPHRHNADGRGYRRRVEGKATDDRLGQMHQTHDKFNSNTANET